MKLITEEISNVQIITEGKGASKKLYIEGVFLQGNIKNRNGRMYPIETLSKEVNRYNETFVQKGRALGELGHPDGPTVNLDRVSHKITSLVAEGNNFRGKAQILNTPMGKIASSLLDEGVMLGVSSRGVGSLREDRSGAKIVGEDFMLATAADIVADPSAPDAFVQKGRALGELGHPDGPTVNLDRVSHKITSLVAEGNNFRGKAQILNTPMGKIASSLLDEGVMLGVSSRGVGSLREDRSGAKVVGEDFMLATAADIVADPSAPDAFVQGIMEGKEWVWEGGILREQLAEKTQKRINTLVDQRMLEEHKLNLFNDFLLNL